MKSKNNSNNLIIKTALVLLLVSMFLLALFMVAFPAKMADLTDEIGLTKISMKFEKVSYERTEDINTLAKILNYAIFTENDTEIAEFGMEMLNHEHYADYVEFLGINSMTQMSYNVYCETYIMQSLYKCGMQDEAIAVLSNSIATGYQTYGAGIVLSGDVASAGDVEFAKKMLEIYEKSFVGASEIKGYNITLEALIVAEIVGDNETEMWNERLSQINQSVAK